jgi:hypothetical protein
MLNQPIETGITAGEEFAQNVLGRMNRAHEAFVDKSHTLAEPPEQARERIEKFRRDVIARISELAGLSFDENGRCTNPEKFRMNAEFKEKWAQVCREFGTEKNAQRGEQLLKEAGTLLRGAVETPPK